jgi:hypothetical protein
LSFLAGAIPAKRPEPPVVGVFVVATEALKSPAKRPEPPVVVVLAVAAEALPSPLAGVVANNEVVDFVFPNREPLGFGLFIPPSGDFAEVARPIAKGLSSVDVIGRVLNNSLCGGFVSAISPLGRSGDGVLWASPLDLPLVDPNNVRLGFGMGFAEPVSLVASQLNTTDPGFVLAGFGEGILSF